MSGSCPILFLSLFWVAFGQMTEGDFDFKLEFANSKLLLRADQEDDALDWINAIRLAMPRARILKKGMLRKRGEKNRAYQERYFELSAMDLAYFENEVCASGSHMLLFLNRDTLAPSTNTAFSGFSFPFYHSEKPQIQRQHQVTAGASSRSFARC